MDDLNRSGMEMLVDGFGWMNLYWSDPAFSAYCDEQRERERRRCHAAIDAGMARLNEKQRKAWGDEG